MGYALFVMPVETVLQFLVFPFLLLLGLIAVLAMRELPFLLFF